MMAAVEPQLLTASPRSVRVEWPYSFDGNGALQWLDMMEQFFHFYGFTDPYRLKVATIYFDGPVVPWFQELQQSKRVTSWASLKMAILVAAVQDSWLVSKTAEDDHELLDEMPKSNQGTDETLEGKSVIQDDKVVKEPTKLGETENKAASMGSTPVSEVAHVMFDEMPEKEMNPIDTDLGAMDLGNHDSSWSAIMELNIDLFKQCIEPVDIYPDAVVTYGGIVQAACYVDLAHNYKYPVDLLMISVPKRLQDVVVAEYATVRHQIEVLDDKLAEMDQPVGGVDVFPSLFPWVEAAGLGVCARCTRVEDSQELFANSVHKGSLSVTTLEMIFDIVYMLFKLGLSTYLTGNMTDLVDKGPCHTMEFRNNIPAASTFVYRNHLSALLRHGLILCNILNKVTQGFIPKIAENSVITVALKDGTTQSAIQYFEIMRKLLVAVAEMQMLTFETSDIEKGDSSVKVVDCTPCLTGYYVRKLAGEIGIRRYRGTVRITTSINLFHSSLLNATNGDGLPDKSVLHVSWNSMLSECVQNGLHMDAISFLRALLEVLEGLREMGHPIDIVLVYIAGINLSGWPNFAFMLTGLLIHRKQAPHELGQQQLAWNSMLADYVQCSHISQELHSFSNTPEKAVVSGDSQQLMNEEAFQLFQRMQAVGFWPERLCFVCTLHECVQFVLFLLGNGCSVVTFTETVYDGRTAQGGGRLVVCPGCVVLSVHISQSSVSCNIARYYIAAEVVIEAHCATLSSLSGLGMRSIALTVNVSMAWIPPCPLQILNLHNCQLVRQFPSGVGTQRYLMALDIATTGISDELPAEPGTFSQLQKLIAPSNSFSGHMIALCAVKYVVGVGRTVIGKLHEDGPLQVSDCKITEHSRDEQYISAERSPIDTAHLNVSSGEELGLSVHSDSYNLSTKTSVHTLLLSSDAAVFHHPSKALTGIKTDLYARELIGYCERLVFKGLHGLETESVVWALLGPARPPPALDEVQSLVLANRLLLHSVPLGLSGVLERAGWPWFVAWKLPPAPNLAMLQC